MAFAAIAFAAVIASCDTDAEKSTYVPSDNAGVTFRATIFYNTEVETGDVVEIELDRAVADGALTVPLSYTETSGEGVTAPSSVTFADGEYSTSITMDVSAMVPGTAYKGTLEITDSSLYDENVSISSISVTLQMVYTWNDYGTCQFYDYWMFSTDYIVECEIQKAEGFEHYRVFDPWPSDYMSACGWDGYVSGSGSDYFDFDIDDDGYVTYDVIHTGWTYDYYGYEMAYYLPSSYKSNYAAYDAYNGLMSNNVIQFYWFVTLYGYGYWGIYPAYLAMPDCTIDFQAWLVANGF